ncbi:MAG: Mor transcription activator family protein [Gammaproteobacteria bacterium]
MDHGDLSQLPHNARMVLNAIGPEATWRLIKARGGTRIYVPRLGEPIEHSPLYPILGAEALAALVNAFSGDQFILPRCMRYMVSRRNAEICRRHLAGEPVWALAVEFSLTESTVWQICARGGLAEADVSARTMNRANERGLNYGNQNPSKGS